MKTATGSEVLRLSVAKESAHFFAHLEMLIEDTHERDGKALGDLGGRPRAWQTRAGSATDVWGTLVGVFGFAGNAKRRELRIVDGRPNPCDGVLPPERGARRSRVFPYPSELLASEIADGIPDAIRALSREHTRWAE